ncbi:hypothetical protein EXIGLDRAFT_231046 [Exidia glandulosa HHB12029]|uniref:Ribonuclease H1 N-terminal domain-containing protein n=1 Tax=Exidia glandulosa HHB12029 TaxID=1314781 RepID=A0A165E589_EXIGL|nr:hypothetical protein EXIGLDRAFT_231046 [Exidia glandulosa HHB12029]
MPLMSCITESSSLVVTPSACHTLVAMLHYYVLLVAALTRLRHTASGYCTIFLPCASVLDGGTAGLLSISTSRDDAKRQTEGYSGSKYQGFETLHEAQAHMRSMGARLNADGVWVGPRERMEQRLYPNLRHDDDELGQDQDDGEPEERMPGAYPVASGSARVEPMSSPSSPVLFSNSVVEDELEPRLSQLALHPQQPSTHPDPPSTFTHALQGLSCDVVYVASSGAGIGVFFGPGNARNASERYPRARPDELELIAAIRALERAAPYTRLLIHTESQAHLSATNSAPLHRYLRALLSARSARVQWVGEVYDCGLVREGRRGALNLAHRARAADESGCDWDAKLAALQQPTWDAGPDVLKILD